MNRVMPISTLPAALVSLCNLAHANPSSPAVPIDPAHSCSLDLAVLPDVLIASRTGAADNRRHRGDSAIASALERTMREAASVKSSDDCARAPRRSLTVWREGHPTSVSLAKAA